MSNQKKARFILPAISEEALDKLPFGVYVINKDGIIEYFNMEMVKMSGAKTADEVVGLNTLTLPTYQQYGLTKYFKKGLAGEPFRIESVKYVSYIGQKETIRHYNGIPVKDESGRVQKLLCIVEDITERKKVEEALRKEKDRARQYLDIAGVLLIVVDADKKIVRINRKGCEILGYKKEEELIGMSYFNIFIPERLRDEVLKVFKLLMAGEVNSAEYFENPVLTKSGKERIIAWHNAVLKNEQGKIYAILCSGEDITERKKAEEKLKKRTEELGKANKLMVGRELKMVELKKKIKELEEKLKDSNK